MIFKHIIGKSTFRYGFTIPKRFYSDITIPEKGNRRKINLIFGENKNCLAWLSRLNNASGHLQVRYDGKYGLPFINWLRHTFKGTFQNNNQSINEFVEIEAINDENFFVKEYPLLSKNYLYFSDIIIHKLDSTVLSNDQRFLDIVKAVRNIPFEDDKRQMHYNFRIKEELSNAGWLNEQKVVDDNKVKLKCDYRKEDFQLEIEFGNARTYYQDLIKFVMAHNSGLIKLGGLIVPSSKFAKHLCNLGSKNAYKMSDGARTKYSGMMDFKKAAGEFPYIENIFLTPFVILSLDYQR